MNRSIAIASAAAVILGASRAGAASVNFSDAALATAGLPPRPHAAFASPRYQTWMRVIRAARAPIDATFLADGSRARQPNAQPMRVIQPDWAGAVLFAPGALPMRIPPHRFATIEGEWTVPFAKPTINCSNRHEQTDGSSLWIAIDGWMSNTYEHAKGKDGKYHRYQSTDILQAGSESDVACYSGGPSRRYPTYSYFWIEWDGVKNIAVTPGHRNLPLEAGDTIYAKIAADTTGQHAWQRATLWFVDETAGFYLPARTFHSGCLDCGNPYQRPATLVGDSAEWMTESTFYFFKNASLPNSLDDFGHVTLMNAFVTDQDGVTYSPGAPAGAVPNIDWMTWEGTPLSQGGTLLACSKITGASSVEFARAPYAIATPGQQGQYEPKPRHC